MKLSYLSALKSRRSQEQRIRYHECAYDAALRKLQDPDSYKRSACGAWMCASADMTYHGYQISSATVAILYGASCRQPLWLKLYRRLKKTILRRPSIRFSA